ncbi:MAG: 4'-phosphopantetheinyl transferase superfamily protein [Deltaproteobacteria bacterium]|nr:4'-phosphopantetheinyl transferase superfamily protein [Deltaproteobacteria bacterium]
MGVGVAKAGQEITVQAVILEGRGPVFYASLPVAPEPRKGCRTNRAGDQHRLVASLWDHLVELRAGENPLGKGAQAAKRAPVPIQVVHDPLGRPQLRWGENRGPAISFSEGGGRIWAALCGDDSEIGIDVAETAEFQGEYPVHRVFHESELHEALRLTGGDLAGAAALLWSVKEAVAKALGCAFHSVSPRQINVYPAVGRDGGFTFRVGLSGKARVRFPSTPGGSIRVRSLPRAQMWLSIALLNRQDR